MSIPDPTVELQELIGEATRPLMELLTIHHEIIMQQHEVNAPMPDKMVALLEDMKVEYGY